MNGGKKSTTYTWNARSSQDCIKDLITLCQSLQRGLEARYDNIVPSSVGKLCKVFDLEEVVKHMRHYKVVDGKLVIRREDRIEREQSGSSEFNEFFRYVCALPHVKAGSFANTQSHSSEAFQNDHAKDILGGIGELHRRVVS